MSQHLLVLWGVGAVAFIAGAAMLAIARASDRRNYIIERATPMPLRLVNERDDVWLRGTVECDRPLVAPYFSLPCVYYDYRLEERVMRTRRTKHGTSTYYTWETRERRSERVDFRLRDGDLTILVPLASAELDDLPSKSEQLGNWRHSLKFLPCPSTVSVVGSVGEKRARLERFANIPLIVTPRERDDYVSSLELGEKVLRFFGFLFLWAGAAAAFYGLFDWLSWPGATGGRFAPWTLACAAGAATAVFVPLWALYIYNTFVTYEIRAENAWRQIDVDLKMRYDLVPQLVSAVKGFMEHERELLERLLALRSQALARARASEIAAEGALSRAVVELRAAVERYPELKSQPLVARLMRELTALEEKISHGRTIYNQAVQEYNSNVLSFPRMILARLCGFREKEFFRAS